MESGTPYSGLLLGNLDWLRQQLSRELVAAPPYLRLCHIGRDPPGRVRDQQAHERMLNLPTVWRVQVPIGRRSSLDSLNYLLHGAGSRCSGTEDVITSACLICSNSRCPTVSRQRTVQALHLRALKQRPEVAGSGR